MTGSPTLSAVAMLNLLLPPAPPLSPFLTKVTRTTSKVKLSVFQTKCQLRYTQYPEIKLNMTPNNTKYSIIMYIQTLNPTIKDYTL